jgi:hypothetical protein
MPGTGDFPFSQGKVLFFVVAESGAFSFDLATVDKRCADVDMVGRAGMVPVIGAVRSFTMDIGS